MMIIIYVQVVFMMIIIYNVFSFLYEVLSA